MRSKLWVQTCFAVASALLAWGCVQSANGAAKVESGQHPKDWIPTHYLEFVKNPDQCRSCHGSTKDPAQAGGISKVSCFTCHPKGPEHPAGWATPSQHGRLGAQAVADPAGNASGMAYCTKCHAPDYKGYYTAVSCYGCHTKAPHPDKPWEKASSYTVPNHNQTDASNAFACSKCHTAGANSSLKPTSTPPAGTAPSCFNNTLCHDKNINP